MELWVNGKQVDPGIIDEQMEFEGLMDLVAARFTPPGETVTEVVVDGEALNPLDPKAQVLQKACRLQKVEIRTQDPKRLAYETLKEGAVYLDRLIHGMGLIAERYRQGDAVEGGRLLAMAVDGIQWFVTMIEKAEHFVPLDYTTDRVEDTTLIEHYGKLHPLVETLVEAQTGQSWDDLADLLDGPFRAYFEQWRSILDWMIARSESQAEGSDQ